MLIICLLLAGGFSHKALGSRFSVSVVVGPPTPAWVGIPGLIGIWGFCGGYGPLPGPKGPLGKGAKLGPDGGMPCCMAMLAPTGGMLGCSGCEDGCGRFLFPFFVVPVRVGLEGGGALSDAAWGLEGGGSPTPGLLPCGVLGLDEGLAVGSGPLVSSFGPLLLFDGVAAFSAPLLVCLRFSAPSVFCAAAGLPGVGLPAVVLESPLSAWGGVGVLAGVWLFAGSTLISWKEKQVETFIG